MNDRWNYHGVGDNWPAPWTIRTPPVAQELFDAIADIVNMRDQPWRLEAACRGVGPTLFYPEQHDMLTAQTALEVCSGCPVATECRDAGDRERYGVWGGSTVTTRRGWASDAPVEKPERPLPPITHGTHGGYQQHRRQGTMCDDCRQARNEHRAAIRAVKGWRAA